LGAIGNLAGTHKEHGGNNKIQKKNLTPPHPLKPQNEKKKNKKKICPPPPPQNPKKKKKKKKTQLS